MAPIKNISRRHFLKNMGLASGGLILATSLSSFSHLTEDHLKKETFNPNLFIELLPDGRLILVASRSEMGQGIRTSLTSVIADEMEADWSRVTVKQATGNAIYGDQNTDGSKSVRNLYQSMREMGATAKAMLISAASKTWKVPETECVAENHFVIHTSGKKIGYGDLVSTAITLDIPDNVKLKSSKDFKYIGKELPSIDIHDIISGKAIFGLDKRVPNLKFAAIKRCPVTFGTVKSFDKTDVLKIPGVIDVIEVPRIIKPFGALGGVAVIATSTWAAFKGKEALKIDWDYGANAEYTTNTFITELTETVQKPGKVNKSKGNIDQAFTKGDKLIEHTYQLPHLVHTPMEVPNAISWVKDGTCEVWAPLQTPQAARKEVADYLGINQEKVTVNVTLLGGGFGRKSKPDYVVEATILSKEIQGPVQVVWTREDDIQHSYYHTTSAQYLKASLDNSGRVTGWLHRLALPTIKSTFQPGANYPLGGEIGSALNVPYDIPNMQFETGKADAHLRIGWLRSVVNIPNAFCINVFSDELAYEAGIDPLEFRLQLIGSDRIEKTKEKFKYDTAKLKHVLKKAAKNAGYGNSLPEGHAIGLAVHYSFFSYVAAAIEVSIVDNKVKIHNVNMVIDCGVVVNKNSVRAQMEGAVIFGLSLAYYGNISTTNGQVEQNNFNDYKIIRMPEAPKTHVEIIESESAPTGVGEPGVPVIAPALVNAIFKATGQRYRSLPLSKHGIV
ncbi:molybdopterin-dependent oxidoreductase [Tamlana sp. 2_MG-2023]|uniref:xanthine dehydrogenase family protein molybdopterin-binding subunit n=1 Tax=unclassified Tamlana TaxID=2614803 RepID=UPI0026E2B9BC|nr:MULTISPECIES: molybdopterin cofactor-binding domain-containing protein [unclassified Tamlana]MDO6761199.1 molybdopterin-dependent oxidoreductase [Tamlana sp. 2_MG-2023]MDO6791682.1 molybdopterin-dependent oxidoreductase [Tamlana sp. 1_MG-2023]